MWWTVLVVLVKRTCGVAWIVGLGLRGALGENIGIDVKMGLMVRGSRVGLIVEYEGCHWVHLVWNPLGVVCELVIAIVA